MVVLMVDDYVIRVGLPFLVDITQLEISKVHSQMKLMLLKFQ